MAGKVLVVEDESDLRFVLRHFFERAGYDVTEAGNGASALEVLRGCRPDLIVTDLMMPVMNGFELIKRLRDDPATAGIPIMAVSGNWELDSGADAVVAKPFHPNELLKVAEALLKDGRDRQ